MTPIESNSSPVTRLPRWLVITILVISILPAALILAGVNLGVDGAEANALTEAPSVSHSLHTILEWTGVVVAILTVFLGFLHFGVKGEVTAPIIGFGLLCAGVMDGFNVLATDGLLFGIVMVGEEFTSFAWLLSRTLNAAAFVFGAVVFIISGRVLIEKQRRKNLRVVLGVGTAFVAIAALTIAVLAGRSEVMTTLYPDSAVPRPWEIVPLLFFFFGGLYVFPTFFKWHPSVFSHGLLVSMVPQIITQLHMAFGSHSNYDSHFVAAHLLKVVAYTVPMLGLLLDYRATYRAELEASEKLMREALVHGQAEDALRRDRDLLLALLDHTDDAVYVKDISHRFTRVNKVQAEIMGIKDTLGALGRAEKDFFAEDVVLLAQQNEQKVIESGSAVADVLVDFKRTDGASAGSRKVTWVPLKDKNQQVVAVLGVSKPA